MYQNLLIAAITLAVLVILYYSMEGMKDYYYAFEQRHPSPGCYRYFGRETPGIFGYDQTDQFLRNQLQYEQGMGPQLQGWAQFRARDKVYI